MAFSFGNSGNAMLGSAAGAGGLSQGPDLEVIQTEGLGFLSIAGDAKVRLTAPWAPLPSSTASLMSVAPRQGLVAAAGPDGITLATTESVRKAFEGPKEGDSDTRAFQPQLKLPMPMRVSQLAFTADETYLILSAETGGGLAVYETQALLRGSTQTIFELATNGEPLRALVPNPTPEKAELCAIVTNNGNLHIANLKERQISNPLKAQVSCISWSTKGKQLVAGLADGTIYQMTPEGEGKATIPKPPNVGNAHVASLSWLENNVFLAIHNSTNESPPTSAYHIITRQPPSNFAYQKLTDPVDPFGSEKVPHHSILRLKDFPPNLQDLLIVASTASPDVGLLSRSKSPLSPDQPADAITNVFTTTELADDSKRASLPMSEDMDNTVPIGFALDLSSKDKVYKPIPAEEIEESAGPLPGLWVLNHEGILSSWWVVYAESVRQGTTYPGLAVLSGSAPASMSAASPAPAPALPSAFSTSTSTSAFGAAQPRAPAFGSASALGTSQTSTPAFGSASALGSSQPIAPSFGGASALGAKPSPWASTPASGTASTGGAAFGSSTFGSSPASSAPAFGKPATIGFGQSSMVGMRSSPWATSGAASSTTPAFGQSGFAGLGGSAGKSVFGSGDGAAATPSAAPASGGFAGFSGSSGFASLGNNSAGGSVFGSKPSGNSFASPGPVASSMDTDTAFPAPKQDKPSTSVFGSQPFKLGTTFKADPATKDDNEKPASGSGSSLFGGNFGRALVDTAKQPPLATPSKDEDMDAESPAETPQAKSPFTLGVMPSTTPTTTPAPAKFDFKTTAAPKTGIFGFSSTPSSGLSGIFNSPNNTKSIDNIKSTVQTPEIKVESQDAGFGDAPLPPESTSKTSFQPGGSSSSSSGTADQSIDSVRRTPLKGDSAPLPPDFLTPSKTVESAPLPPDFLRTPKPAATRESATPPESAPLPSDSFRSSTETVTGKPSVPDDAPLPPDFLRMPRQSASDLPLPPNPFAVKPAKKANDAPLPKELPAVPSVPESEESSELEDEGSEGGSEEGSGIDVGKDLSPSNTGLTQTPGFTPQSSFGGMGGSTFSIARPEQERPRGLFGEIRSNAPIFPQPSAISPRSPSPVRSAIPNRVLRPEASRSVSAPGMASQILGASKQSQSRLGASIVGRAPDEDPILKQRAARARREAEEAQPLVDEEDDEIQQILASEIQGSLKIDDFIAHSNVASAAEGTIPAQVEAVYRDINSMIDTLGLNARSLASFIKGHVENYKEGGRHKDDLEIKDDWVLCEIDDLGDILDNELATDLEEGRVQDVEGKVDVCEDLTREMSRLRSKQGDLKKLISVRLDPDQTDMMRSLPLSAEQATQQNELRREYANFSKQLADAEEALTILKTRIASASAASGKGGANVPTVDAVIRTITKMTTMVEKRSGDVDVLENQMRKLRFSSVNSREGSPMVTPQKKGSVMFSPEPVFGGSPRNPRNSLMSSVTSYGGRGTPPRKKLSGFSQEEKSDLMDKRAKRQAVLGRLKANVEKNGVSVWAMEDID